MASANTLTNLIPDFYQSLDTVSRELTGFIPSVMLDASASRAAVGQTVRSFVAPASTAADITAASYAPDTGGQTIATTSLSIAKARAVPVQWTGEEQASISGGHGFGKVFQNQISQAMRTLVNEIETDLAALHIHASRAYGTAGTTPFASSLIDPANVRKILSDNGAPIGDMQLVINTTAGASMRTLAQLTKANEGGSDALLRQGELLNIHGMSVRESAQVATNTAGTGASYLSNGALAVGATSVAVDAGTGTVLAGDIVTFAGDTNKYVVVTALTGGSFVLAAPGLHKALADNVAITVVAAAARNMAFDRNAIVLLARAPMVPAEGDQATDATIVTDPRSGLSFEIRMYKGYRQVHYEVAMAWGVSCVKPAHVALLLG